MHEEIYALLDPTTDEPFYIGRSKNPESRRRNHERTWTCDFNWHTIRRVPEAEGAQAERDEIHRALDLGFILENQTLRRGGPETHAHSECDTPRPGSPTSRSLEATRNAPWEAAPRSQPGHRGPRTQPERQRDLPRGLGIDPDVYSRFQSAVLHKHGKLRGVLRDEANAAILRHIDQLEEP